MVSNTAIGYFHWFVNNSKRLSAIYVSYEDVFQAGSGMVTLELAVGDTVSLKSYNSNISISSLSCYTLIKIK